MNFYEKDYIVQEFETATSGFAWIQLSYSVLTTVLYLVSLSTFRLPTLGGL
jgi:hypothetical protein